MHDARCRVAGDEGFPPMRTGTYGGVWGVSEGGLDRQTGR